MSLNFNDLRQVVTTLRGDIDDTVGKLMQGTDFIQLIIRSFDDIDFSFDDLNQLNQYISNYGGQFILSTAGSTLSFTIETYNSHPYLYEYRIPLKGEHVYLRRGLSTTTGSLSYSLIGKFPDDDWDSEPINFKPVNNVTSVLSSIEVKNRYGLPTSFSAIIDAISQGNTMQSVFNQILSFAENGGGSIADFITIVKTKAGSITPDMGNMLSELANSGFLSNPKAIINRCVDKFKKLAGGNVDQDGNVHFTDINDIVVENMWTTVLTGVTTLISAATLALGAIGMVFSAAINIGSQIINWIGRLTAPYMTPLLPINEKGFSLAAYYPIIQSKVNTSSTCSEMELPNFIGYGNILSVDEVNKVTNLWINADEPDMIYQETFIKPCHGFHDYIAIHENLANPNLGINKITNPSMSSSNDASYFAGLQSEPMQVAVLSIQAMCLAYQMRPFAFWDQGGTLGNPATFRDKVKQQPYDSSYFTESNPDIFAFLHQASVVLYERGENTTTTTLAENELFYSYGLSWEFFTKYLLPWIHWWTNGRSVPADDNVDGRILLRCKYDIAEGVFSSEHLTDVAINYGLSFNPRLIQGSEMMFQQTHATGAGFVATILVTTLVTVATAAAAVVTAITIKKKLTKMKLKMSNDCSNAMENYNKVLNGIDVDDPEGVATRQYTDAEKAQYLKTYKRKVLKFNILGKVFFGGASWNMTSGWAEEASGDSSSATNPVADSVSGLLGAGVPAETFSGDVETLSLDSIYHVITGK